MPRKPRHYLPGVPAHVIQRGNNRQACFFEEADYRTYLDYLGEAALRHGCRIHAYVLMTNHVHLLLTPNTVLGISRLIQSIGRRYVRYVNELYARTGTLWEGRHKGHLIQSERHLLQCYQYVELNPVRAGMVTSPANYRWSSYRHHALGEQDPIIEGHQSYDGLGKTAEHRQRVYRDLFVKHLGAEVLDDIRRAAQYCVPLGNGRFKRQIEQALGRKVGHAKRGRPKKVILLGMTR